MNIFRFYCLCTFIALCIWGGVASAQIVEIPDPNLKRAIQETLDMANDITVADMLQLTELEVRQKQIADLTGLEYATNLRRLILPHNNISNLNPLSELFQLDHLGLWVNPISDLSPLSSLAQLRGLDLAGCHILDITPLANLTGLRWLTLQWQQGTWITNIKPLENLVNLNNLRLSGNRIVDITPLTNLIELKTLWLDNNDISDITPLANLTMLQELQINNNRIIDYSPLDGLSLARLDRDSICELPGLPIQDRIENRNLPSIVQPWGERIINLPDLSREDMLAYHDLYWQYPPFGLQFQLTPQGYEIAGNIANALARRDGLLAKNPNMLFLAEIRVRDAHIGFHYPEDWPYWLRDEAGNLVGNADLIDTVFLIDFTRPEAQDIIVQRAIAISKCGLYDGIFIDWWNEGRVTLASPDWSKHYSTAEEELEIKISMLKRIRAQVPNDFLILSNNNRLKLPFSAPYMNGSFMETFRDNVGGYREYAREGIIEIEDALIWLEVNMREPQINCLEGWGIPTEPPDSPDNRRWMRLFTTMSLTLSDGYVLYNVGWDRTKSFPGHHHHWYDFWDANLGQPIGPTAQRYQDIEGLYIREFTNGWAVYNRSGTAQEISLTEEAMGVSSNQTGRTHQLADLDGEIYLRAGTRPAPTDLNGDGIVNVLDLILVAQHFGTTKGDINGDGITNILDLILVAQHLGETSTPAAPAAFHVSLSPETVQKWIDMAYAQNDGSVIFAQGIAMLERLLALMIPDKTVLRANYPNPFNPETWIPYHLASETEVRISIYDIQGALVRQFNLGYQKAGYYTNRTKAAHWDGRNEIGEPVASGIYFYTLTTDDYTGTRRMVILK